MSWRLRDFGHHIVRHFPATWLALRFAAVWRHGQRETARRPPSRARGCLRCVLSGVVVEDAVEAIQSPEQRLGWDGESFRSFELLRPHEPSDPTREDVVFTVMPAPRPARDREILQRRWQVPVGDSGGQALLMQSLEETGSRLLRGSLPLSSRAVPTPSEARISSCSALPSLTLMGPRRHTNTHFLQEAQRHKDLKMCFLFFLFFHFGSRSLTSPSCHPQNIYRLCQPLESQRPSVGD